MTRREYPKHGELKLIRWPFADERGKVWLVEDRGEPFNYTPLAHFETNNLQDPHALEALAAAKLAQAGAG